MPLFSVRRVVLACAVAAAAVMALAGAGAASAALKQCEGANIKGKGASLQELAQNKVWDSLAPEGFNKNANADACNGTQGSKATPLVEEYGSVGSGAGLRSWGQETKVGESIEFGPKNAYVGTDEPPNLAQKEEIEKHAGAKLLTVPVLQAAVAVLFHLPAGCTEATSRVAKGRMTLSNKKLEGIFRGTVTKWTELEEDGNQLKPAGCATGKEITRAVREDGSGTTSIFKKYLDVVEPGEIDGPKGAGEKTTWKKLAESASNAKWPDEEAGRPVKKAPKGSGVAKLVEKEAGTIGYANVADARVNGFAEPAAGKGKSVFWVELENGVNAKTKKATYKDPASNLEAAAKGKSNCKGALYTNGKVEFPPESTEEAWNEVTTALTSKVYTLCGMTYDLSLTEFVGTEGVRKFGEAGEEKIKEATEAEARQVFDYFEFMVDNTGKVGTNGGAQKLITSNQDYESLPTSSVAAKNVLKIAEKGAAKITYNGVLFK